MACYVPSGWVEMSQVIQVREWDVDTFHKKVLELESQGFLSRLDSYRIIPDMNPDTGIVTHLHTMEMYKPE